MTHALIMERVAASQASGSVLVATNRSHINYVLRQRSYTAQWIQIVSKTVSWMTDDTSTGAERQPLDRFHDGAAGGPLGRIQTTITRMGKLQLDRC